MTAAALDAVLERQFALAALRLRLDEELGTLHGLAWDDFVLLTGLDEAGGALPTRTLAARVGLSASALVLRLLPLEKTGLITRAVSQAGVREVLLRAPGRRLLAEARETAQAVCAACASAGAGEARVA
jgi:MarR family transcriptional regulator, organic hydroperoxide resistance regulator